MTNQEPAVLSGGIREAANLLGISERGAYAAARKERIPAIRLGGRWIIPRAAWDAFLRGEWNPEPRVERGDP